jgi:hypothetical protein
MGGKNFNAYKIYKTGVSSILTKSVWLKRVQRWYIHVVLG